MFCPKCGAKNEDDAAFCGDCGASLARPDAGGVVAVPMDSDIAARFPAKSQKKISKRLVAIVVALIVVILALFGVYRIFFYVGSCYVMTSNDYLYEGTTGSSPLISHSNKTFIRSDNGGILKTVTKEESGTAVLDEETTTNDFIDIGNGYAIDAKCSGTYETDIFGYTTHIDVFSESGEQVSAISYEYYRPGIIKSITSISPKYGSTSTKSYDEDGRVISSCFEDPNGEQQWKYYKYELSADGRTLTQYEYDDEALTTGEEVYVNLLDEHGMPIRTSHESKDYESVSTAAYEKVEHPTKFIWSISRLIG